MRVPTCWCWEHLKSKVSRPAPALLRRRGSALSYIFLRNSMVWNARLQAAAFALFWLDLASLCNSALSANVRSEMHTSHAMHCWRQFGTSVSPDAHAISNRARCIRGRQWTRARIGVPNPPNRYETPAPGQGASVQTRSLASDSANVGHCAASALRCCHAQAEGGGRSTRSDVSATGLGGSHEASAPARPAGAGARLALQSLMRRTALQRR